MARKGRCPRDGKVTFTSYDTAAGCAARIGGRVYWCAAAGGYHITGSGRREYARARSAAA